MVLSFDKAPAVGSILDRISCIDPSSIITESKYLKLWKVSRFWPSILMSDSDSEPIPLVLLVISLVFSVLIAMPFYVVDAFSSRLKYLISSSAFPARGTMSPANRKFVIVLPPMLTDPSWSSKASVMVLSLKMLKRVGETESRHPCLTPAVILNHSPTLPL